MFFVLGVNEIAISMMHLSGPEASQLLCPLTMLVGDCAGAQQLKIVTRTIAQQCTQMGCPHHSQADYANIIRSFAPWQAADLAGSDGLMKAAQPKPTKARRALTGDVPPKMIN